MFSGASLEDVNRRRRLAQSGKELLEWIATNDDMDDAEAEAAGDADDAAAANGAAANGVDALAATGDFEVPDVPDTSHK